VVEVEKKKPQRGKKRKEKKRAPARGKAKKKDVEEVKIDLLEWEKDSRKAIAYKDDFLQKIKLKKNPKNYFLVAGQKQLAIKIKIF